MAEKRPTLCVVAGPNGSGKTTTTVQLLNNEWTADSLYINPDNIAQEMFGDWRMVVTKCLFLRLSLVITSRSSMLRRPFRLLIGHMFMTTRLTTSCLDCFIVRLMDSSLSNMWKIFQSGLGCC